MASLDHLHVYEARKPRKKGETKRSVYRCVHPDCTHFAQKEDINGKRAMCKCGEAFIIQGGHPRRQFRYFELKCLKCQTKGKSEEGNKIVNTVIDDLFSNPTREVSTVLQTPSVSDEKQAELPLNGPSETPLLDSVEPIPVEEPKCIHDPEEDYSHDWE